MFSPWLALLIFLSPNVLVASNLRCNEDLYGSLQLIENCRACVIFIAPANLPTTRSTTRTTRLPKNMIMSNDEPSIEELFLFDEHKRRRRRRRRGDSNDTIIHQQCARESDGPLFGYDQTHCYCNSNQCNSNIQRCIYEVTSKRHFACYHGSNSSQYPLEIRHKCRSCRIRTDFQSMHHYECLTFGEREQNDRTQCVCQRPMCNENLSSCQRFQPASSQPRNNAVVDLIFNSTTSKSTASSTTRTTRATSTTIRPSTTTTPLTTTTVSRRATTTTAIPSTTTTMPSTTTTFTSTITFTSATTSIITSPLSDVPLNSTTPPTTTDITITETEEELSTENPTQFELTAVNDTLTSPPELQPLKTVMIVVSNHGNRFSSKLHFHFALFPALSVLVIYSMWSLALSLRQYI